MSLFSNVSNMEEKEYYILSSSLDISKSIPINDEYEDDIEFKNQEYHCMIHHEQQIIRNNDMMVFNEHEELYTDIQWKYQKKISVEVLKGIDENTSSSSTFCNRPRIDDYDEELQEQIFGGDIFVKLHEEEELDNSHTNSFESFEGHSIFLLDLMIRMKIMLSKFLSLPLRMRKFLGIVN